MDPSGNVIVANFYYGNKVHRAIGAHFEQTGGVYDHSVASILGISSLLGLARPDLTMGATVVSPGEIYEI